MRVTPAYLESVASFYDMFELEPAGRHTIYVCTNISCTLRGADDLLARAVARRPGAPVNGTSPDGEFRLRSFECLGACDIAPMASIDGYYRGPLTRRRRHAIVERPARAAGPSASCCPRRATRATTGGGSRARRRDGSERPTGEGGVTRRAGGILFKHFDAPDRRRIEVYEQLGGYRALRKALTEMTPDQVVKELDGSGPARARRRRASRWARRRASSPTATSTSTSAATPTSRSRARSRTAS